MVTPDEAHKVMQEMVKAIPEGMTEPRLLVSKEIAKALHDSYKNLLTTPVPIIVKSGEEFKYMGVKCKIA